MKAQVFAALFAATASAALFTPACKTESFCFADCDELGGGGTAGLRDAGADVTIIGGRGGAPPIGGDSGQSDACVPALDGKEICDGKDNDCDGQIDDGIDFTNVRSCGTCANDCTNVENGERAEHSCVPPAVLDGTRAGTCEYECLPGFYDFDDNVPGCEARCTKVPADATTDQGGDLCGRDDDCDNQIDEDVNTCTDANNCGECGLKCNLPNATSTCRTTRTGTDACTPTNTHCAVSACAAGWHDVDKAPANGCEYRCTPSGTEKCDGIDNDCDGNIDNADPDILTGDANVGDTCNAPLGTTPVGECATPAHAGVYKCIAAKIECCDRDSGNTGAGLRNGSCEADTGPQVIRNPSAVLELCNGRDDNCNGQNDENPSDDGGSCGSSVGSCRPGNFVCESGALVCRGTTNATPEVCNGQDDNCDGVIDGTIVGTPAACTSDAQCTSGRVCLPRGGASDRVCVQPPTDVAVDCDVPPAAPAGATSPCRKGTLACVGGVRSCIGSVRPSSTVDTCRVDANCDGVLTNQPDFANDVRNCGSCGNDCNALSGHALFTCSARTCQPTGCEPGYINCDGTPATCERSCTFTSATEQCDGIDNDCDCQIDEGVVAPDPTQVCDVSPAASDPACTGVTVSCSQGTWRCAFPAGFCTGAAPDYCTGQPDVCDNRDNNCNGNTDENFKPPVLNQRYIGQPCFSDDGSPIKHGACQASGAYVCSGTTATACNAVKDQSRVAAEACDGADNDCDGSIDEPFNAKGTNATHFVRPAVTRVGSTWMFQYEASRPGATGADPGTGNGYQTSAPTGTPLQRTQACSAANVLPWFNITPDEAQQTCVARGGTLCTMATWTTACQATNNCTYGYSPRSSACSQPFNGGTRTCNLGLFDFDLNPGNGMQNALLPTADPSLTNCWADWSGTTGNTGASAPFDNIRDIEGNLREITRNGNVYSLMGGSFASQSEQGATCTFDFYTVDANFKLFDTGFRCCFSSDPRL